MELDTSARHTQAFDSTDVTLAFKPIEPVGLRLQLPEG